MVLFVQTIRFSSCKTLRVLQNLPSGCGVKPRLKRTMCKKFDLSLSPVKNRLPSVFSVWILSLDFLCFVKLEEGHLGVPL
jgi:hypothetical protein